MDVFAQITQWLIGSQFLWPLTAVLSAGALYFIIDWFISLYKLFRHIESLLGQDHGNPEVHFMLLKNIQDDLRSNRSEIDRIEDILDGHIPKCDNHFQQIDKITDRTLYDRCPIDNCPAFQRIANGYKDLQARLEVFEIVATESRKRTTESLDKISTELTSLTKEIILTLREVHPK